MNTYIVKYIDGTDLKVAYVQGSDEGMAKVEFKKYFPNINSNKIIEITLLEDFKKDYVQAIAVAKFISFIGWAAIVIAIFSFIVILIEGGVSGAMFAAIPVISTIIGGLIVVVFGQSSRANMESANYSKQMLLEKLSDIK